MPETFIVGEVVRLSVRISDFAGADADPGSLVLKIKPGASATTAYAYGSAPEVVRDAAGRFHADIPAGQAGMWVYRWELSAPNAGAAEGVFSVQKSRIV